MKVARLLGIVAAVALAASALTACQQRVGAAAFVGSSRISESDVSSYVNRDAHATEGQDGATTDPKSQVLTGLILAKIVDRALAAQPGGAPTSGALMTATGQYITTQYGTEGALIKAAEAAGFTAKYAGLYAGLRTKLTILGGEVNDAGDGAKLISTLVAIKEHVTVSPRYGDWSATKLALSSGPTIPSFLKVDSPSGNPIQVDGSSN